MIAERIRTITVAITIAAGIGLLVFSAFSLKTALENRVRLESLTTRHFPVLEKLDASLNGFNRIRELFIQASSSAEKELLSEAGKYYEDALLHLEKLKIIDPDKTEDLRQIQAGLESYFQNGLKIATMIINGQTGEHETLQLIESLSQDLKPLQAMMDQLHERSYQRYSETIQEARRSSERIVYMGILMGSVNLGFILILVLGIRGIQRMGRQIREQNLELQRMGKMKEDFLAKTSHELRTPLHGMIGLAEAILADFPAEIPGKNRKHLEMIILSGRKMSRWIHEILDFSKLGHHGAQLNIHPVSPLKISGLSIEICSPLAAKKSLTVINRIPENCPLVDADEDRLFQIFCNLLGNAIKYTHKGTITLTAENHGDFLEVCVQDTGPGIPENQIPLIFEEFAQGSSNMEGSGLGLSITRKLVEMHKGRMRVESQLGHGSRFFFTLPVSSETSPRSAVIDSSLMLMEDRPIEMDIHDFWEAGSPHLLVVDDDPVNLEVLVSFLANQSFSVTTAMHGHEVLDLLEKEPLPDMILLDVMMPEMNGFELCLKIREHWTAFELPILLLTAKSQPEDILRGFRNGANDYLSKPVYKDELLARIASQLNIRQSLLRKEENLKLQQEIRKRQMAEEYLSTSQRRMMRILDATESAILAFNPNARILFANQQAERLFGYLQEKLLDRSIFVLFPELPTDSLEQWNTASVSFSQGSLVLHKQLELQGLHKTGIAISLNGTLLKLKGSADFMYVLSVSVFPERDHAVTDPLGFTHRYFSEESSAISPAMQSLMEGVLTHHPESLQRETRLVPASMDSVPTQDEDSENKLKRGLTVQIMNLSLKLWEECTGKTKIELAEQSGIWRVYLEKQGTFRVRTFDKYLSPQTLPQNPRWRDVMQTAYFVMENCSSKNGNMADLDKILKQFNDQFLKA
ncbi:MAG: response regulator [SAR324 cluster bacterium]|nr:response regulator [SAR324 cluster bacterium]